jgi:hypothetical protein
MNVTELILFVHRIAAGLPPEVEAPAPFHTILTNFRAAQEYAKFCQNSHVPNRISYLHDLANAIITKRNRQIGTVLQPEFFNQGGLTRVDIPADGIEEPFPIGSDPRHGQAAGPV